MPLLPQMPPSPNEHFLHNMITSLRSTVDKLEKRVKALEESFPTQDLDKSLMNADRDERDKQ